MSIILQACVGLSLIIAVSCGGSGFVTYMKGKYGQPAAAENGGSE